MEQQHDAVVPAKNSAGGVKEIEVTAKQIVDRISISGPSGGAGVGNDGAGGVSLGGIGKLLTGLESYQTNGGAEKKSSVGGEGLTDPSGGGADGGSAGEVSGETGRTQSLSRGTSRHMSIASVDGQVSAEQKAVEQLLEAVQKWVHEAQANSELLEKSHSEKELDNFHWVYSIESYLRSLDTDWTSQKALTHKIASQLMNWLKQLFNFSETEKTEQYNSIHPHWDINGGMTAVAQLSLYLKFPNLISHGYQHFHDESKNPLIYCSDEMIGQQICNKLGLPYTSIGVIDFTDKLWVENLETRIKSDVQSGKVPVALLMNTAIQNLEKGVKLAELNKIWVHFYGNNVLAYFLKRPEANHLGSSFTLDLTRWLKTPKLPYLTLYKRPDKLELRLLELCDLGSPRNEIMCFTPWFVAHVFGKTRLTALVNESIYRGKFLLEMIKRFENLRVVPNWSTLSDGHVILSTLTFQFNQSPRSASSRKSSASSSSPSNKSAETPPVPTMQYIDTLNSWLFHIMERDLKHTLPLEFVYVETRGWNIHLDIIRCRKLTPQDEASILATFESHMQVLQATVNQKLKFHKLVEESSELDWINNENQWAGLGAVRYIPSVHRTSTTPATPNVPEQNGQTLPVEEDATKLKLAVKEKTEKIESAVNEKFKEDIDHLNAKIVDKLKAIDSAFSLGEAPTGEWCVQFGMVTEETDVQELVRLVVSTGQEIEESSEFFNKMSELVRKGIHEAEEELKRESEDALWEEGILRRVPIVGTFVSWFSPPVKEAGVRGRAMNLTQGKVESTENIYKYHMQVEASTFSKKGQSGNSQRK